MTAVNFCELKISRNPAETLVAFSIGSGIVISIYDPVTRAGGMLSFVLPESQAMLSENAERHPYMFADTGLPVLLDVPGKNLIGISLMTFLVNPFISTNYVV